MPKSERKAARSANVDKSKPKPKPAPSVGFKSWIQSRREKKSKRPMDRSIS